MTPRVLSAIQPTSSSFHIGNHLGALQNWVAMQDTHDCVYGIADLHAITVEQDPAALRHQTLVSFAQLLALGIDPDRSVLFVQSHVAEHTQLMWALSCITGLGEANRMTQFKDKAAKGGAATASVGLLTYPILQAADILLPKASVVPVGKDQAAHLELSREIARSFNHKFGETFPEPQAVFTEAPVVLGTDGEKKMSKSIGNTIEILADPADLTKQVMSAVTDTQRPLKSDPGHPEACNVCQLHKVLSPDYEQLWASERAATTGCADLKRLLAERLVAHYAPARERYRELMATPKEIDAILAACARHGVVPGIHANEELAAMWIDRGFRLVTVGYDQFSVLDGLRGALDASRGSAPSGPGSAGYR